MGVSKQAIKRRIRSIEATKKITQAMEMIAISKFQKQKVVLDKNKAYSDTILDVAYHVLQAAEDKDPIWLKPQVDTNPLVIVLTSDLGLCGAYNANVLKYFNDEPQAGAYLVIGTKGYSWFTYRNYELVNHDRILSDDLTFKAIDDAMLDVLRDYAQGKVTSVHVVYTKFINSINFEATQTQILPFQPQRVETHTNYIDTIFEPNAHTILEQLIPMSVVSMVYRLYLEAKTSEQASRRIAMENATENAEELVEELTLKYNQSRQAEITQEISEIIAGADAL